jgi:hypothetical protein
VKVANAFVLANGAIDEASADCGGENLDIAVFPRAERAEDYGSQGGYPIRVGDGWGIVTETLRGPRMTSLSDSCCGGRPGR